MKKLLSSVTFIFFMSACAAAQSPFDGTWKIEVPLPLKTDLYLLQDGVYRCKTCFVPIDVTADGQDHAVNGSPYVDTISIKVVADHTIVQTEKKDGRIVEVATEKVSPDGKTVTLDFSSTIASNAEEARFQEVQKRVDQGPAGAHVISGSWRTTKLEYEKPNNHVPDGG